MNQIVNNRDSTRTANYTYDSLNRIASAQSSGTQWGETFTIDAWGNMTNEAAITGKTLHEGLNTSAGTNNQLAGFGYDAAGNMTSNGSTSYVYDAENRLIWTSGYRYLYDGNGQRVEKCVAATVTTACPTSGTNGTLYWRGTGSDPLDESDLSGNALEEYVFFNGQRVARRDVSTNIVHYYFSDHLGSHGVVENATGTTCEQDIDYYPYGGVENDYCPNTGQNYKFTGKERDGESGLDNFGARYDASSLGRFMTPDWAAKPVTVPYAKFGDPQTLNLYDYGKNSPVSFRDPNGHCVDGVTTWLCAAIVVAAVAATAVAIHSAYTSLKKLIVDDAKAADKAGKDMQACQNGGACKGVQAEYQKAQVQPYVDGAKAAVDLKGAVDAVQDAASQGVNGVTETKEPSDTIDSVKGAVEEGSADAIDQGNEQGNRMQNQNVAPQDGADAESDNLNETEKQLKSRSVAIGAGPD